MGQYNKAVLTTAGENLIARALAGEIKLSITKAKTSDFAYPDNADLKRLTDMQGVRQTVCDPETVVFNETIIQTRVLFSNEDIASTYYIHNIGLYAIDGTQEDLFCIVTAETPDEMPQYNGVASTSYIYNIQNVVQDATDLNITVNPSGTATIQDVLERVDATGGDISETVIETLDTVEDKYPIPTAGESVKRFFGKVLTFLRNIRPLTGDITLYVSANTGSDITGDGSELNPYATVTKALSAIPKNLGGFVATMNISGGTYVEAVTVSNFINGQVAFELDGNITLTSLYITNANLICKTTGSTYELTLSWLSLITQANLNSWGAVNWHITGYNIVASLNVSINVERISSLYASGIILLDGNTGVAVNMSSHSSAYFGTLRGTGFAVGFNTWSDSIVNCAINGLNATQMNATYNGGIVVKSSGAVIGSLASNVTYYVATTGSDQTGNGTSGNPFKTIQHAIDVVPKDLNGYTVIINVADGTYSEPVNIIGFNNGEFRLYSSSTVTLSDNCKVDRISIRYNTCLVVVAGFSIMTTTYDGVVGESCISVNVQYTKVVGNALSSGKSGMAFYRCCTFSVWNCQVSYHNVALLASNSRGVSNNWATCTGNNYGLYSSYGAVITCTGAQPAATTLFTHDGGGSFIYDSGTQISGLIFTGLSCTWGTVSGGYIRDGNRSGDAMVHIAFSITVTTPLTAGQNYSVNGIPPCALEAMVANCSYNSATNYCYVTRSGALIFNPSINIGVGNSFIFGGSYITNS